jgi:hypothetical protein
MAQHHRRVRQYGGQAVAQMMATTKSQTHQTQPLKIKREPTDDGSSNDNKSALDIFGGLRRARLLSIGGNQPSRLDNTRVRICRRNITLTMMKCAGLMVSRDALLPKIHPGVCS